MADTRLRGRVIAAHGRHFAVAVEPTGTVRHCYTRGKKAGPAVGDQVIIQPEGRQEGVIVEILPRRNLLFRSDALRSKQFAANIDQLLLVVASEPGFSGDLLGRMLVAAASAGIQPLIVLNKADLPSAAAARERLAPCEALGIPVVVVLPLDAAQVRERLAPRLQGRSTLLLGQSGMGKSTLLNVLVPDADAATRAHSEALDAGRHTTTHTRLYALPGGGDLIDSPGFQAFGLQHLDPHEIERGFPDFAAAGGPCRFYNCTHRHEPGCAVLKALAQGRVAPARHALYVRILAENEAARKW